MSDVKKVIHILGGGTFSHVRSHLALAAPAFGATARDFWVELDTDVRFDNFRKKLTLTRMAGGPEWLVTNGDVSKVVDEIIANNTTKVVVFNVALCDFHGKIGEVDSGKYAPRLESREDGQAIELRSASKILNRIRQKRKDIFLVAFKTTTGAEPHEQVSKGLRLLKESSANLVLANDTETRNNIIITPEEGVYEFGRDRAKALTALADMMYHRTHLSFTRSTVVDGEPVAWNSDLVYPTLREVVNHCVQAGAYKVPKLLATPATTGHFAAKIGEKEFLTSIRKRNFNEIEKVGLVRVRTDGDDSVISYGHKPSVGGQSQRIIFDTFKDTDCIVHFHCPLKANPRDKVNVVSQYEYECGSHECGENTARGLSKIGNVYCVMLDKHGPNIVFHHSTPASEVIDFIDANFDLDMPTSGYKEVYFGREN